jgi:MFS family permease
VTADTERSATYREVFAVSEYRAVFGAYVLSNVGDMLAKVAVASLVWGQTRSALLAAAAFAIGYLPWVAGGPLLAAIADRMPWRRTLVWCDLARMLLVAVLAIPGIPLPGLLIILFLAALLTPPFEAARSAMLPDILSGERYVLGLAMNNIAAQLSQVFGFVAGGYLVYLVTPRGALLVDAVTFLGSALLLRYWVAQRPAPHPRDDRSSLRTETVAGLRLVFGSRVLRVYTAMVWASAAFAFAPEGLAAPLAEDLSGRSHTIVVGLLLAASPVGTIAGGIVVARLVSPARRAVLLRPLALLSALALVPVAFSPPLPAVLTLYVISGFGMSFLLPLNAMFVRALPVSYRARAFGVVQSGLQISQGIAIVLAGWVADAVAPTSVIGLSGLIGVACIGLLTISWPTPREVLDAVPEPV